jgi:hypothetical protein
MRRTIPIGWMTACLVCAALAANARADVKLHALFSPNVVLQPDKPLPVWGWAAAGEEVAVSLGKESASTKGHCLPPPRAFSDKRC